MISDSRTTRTTTVGLPTTDLLMLVVVLIWGANFSVVKLALDDFPPLVFTTLRFFLATLILLLILRLREGAISFPAGSGRRLIWLGVLGNTCYQILFILGLSMTTAANSALLIATTPAIIALIGALLGIEALTRHVVGGIILAFTGVVLILVARGATLSLQTLGGDLLILLSALCWAGYTLGVRSLGAGISPLQITTLTMLAGLPGLMLVAALDIPRVQWLQISAMSWLGLLYSALLGLVVAYLIWNQSVRLVGSARTAIYGCLIPLVATLIAWPVLGEQPVPMQAVGAVLIISGVLLTRRAPPTTA